MTVATGGDGIAEAGEGALLTAASLGDREAFEVVVHRYGPALHRYARRLVANEADVADVVQATFIAAWRQLGTFRGGSSLKTWLFAICSHKITDNYRIKRAQPIDDQLLEAMPASQRSGDPFTAASNTAFLGALEAALAELPYRQRASWVLREIESMTFPDIGKTLDVSPDAARGHHFRATATLRTRLKRWQ
ncbi:RNA polymerase sigma factor [Mycolicibacterium hodleri]|uniref:RNA polymerase sigma factor n=1 Tax=Mycolicibacterium hodleri TaxID=49897 RepID=UPI001F230E43|nr:sigma-70 family RNA polymerase sigma factor [Mycolicibacterium hodleri]